ncbi:shikimate dehydrogenase [Mesorhizobium sp. ANAO-SY3R2]|uniref:shikimate dehydrogenase n=1 Tax=Mesorhizobium sp. ANAO-SY3R2 TaxID=3166644 RepID=UPI003670DB6F
MLQLTDDSFVDMLGRLVARPCDASVASGAVLIGLVGRGIQLSRSPIMHEREGARLGMSYSYILIDFDKLGLDDDALGGIISAAEEIGFAGLNVTHPFKQSVIQHLDGLAPEASAIGAVNTVVLSGGVRQGHNTDSWGFAESFRDGMGQCSLNRVVQFGAGGAGAAVAYALIELGVDELQIIDSAPERARQLADRMTARFGTRVRAETDVAAALAAADGIVNTTPVGMAKYPGMPFPSSLLTARHWVAEIIYFPQETELLKQAGALGCRTLAGTGMAVYQAVRAFELFTGRAPDRAAMVGHFKAAS